MTNLVNVTRYKGYVIRQTILAFVYWDHAKVWFEIDGVGGKAFSSLEKAKMWIDVRGDKDD